MLSWMDSLHWWRRLGELGLAPSLTCAEQALVDGLTESTVIRRRLPARLATVENGDNVVKVRLSVLHRLHDLGLLRVSVTNEREEVWKQVAPSEQLAELSKRYLDLMSNIRAERSGAGK